MQETQRVGGDHKGGGGQGYGGGPKDMAGDPKSRGETIRVQGGPKDVGRSQGWG